MEENKPRMPGDMNAPKPGVPPELGEKDREMDVLFAKTFNSQAGKKVLTYLRELYVEVAAAGYVVDRNGTINAMASTFQMYQREGQRILVKNIEKRMKRASR